MEVQYPESQKGKIKCTGPGCHKLFDSVAKMKKHKILDTENHDYCQYCDLDFEDFEGLHDHFVQVDAEGKDDNHIICRHCGRRSRSREDRDMHVQRSHPPMQHLNCPGCNKTFHSASDFMWHIEYSKCLLTLRAVQGQIIHKTIVKDLLKNPAIYDNVTTDYRAEEDNEAGGVSLFEDDNKGANLSFLEPVALSESDTKVESSIEKSLAKANITENVHQSRNTSLSIPWGGNSGKDLFPDAKPTPANNQTGFDGQSNLLHHQLWNPESDKYQASAFYNALLEKYTCPFTSCKLQFRTASLLTNHIRQQHCFIEIKCPLCFQSFSHLFKIMLHMENGPRKCNLIHSEQLRDLADKFSGGLLSAKLGYRDDVKNVEFVDFSVNLANFSRLMGPKVITITHQGSLQSSYLDH